MKFAAVLLISCLALCYAQPLKCNTPDGWEARVFLVQPSEGRAGFGRFYYDAPGQRFVLKEEAFKDEVEVAANDYYMFFKERKGFRYNTITKKCTTFPLQEKFRPINISADAVFMRSYVIGSNAREQYGLTVNLWEESLGDQHVFLEYVATDGDNDEDCLPISMTEFGKGPGSPGFRHQSFYDIVLGDNPDAFLLPNDC